MKIGERILKLEQRIRHLAMTDALTGLLNRRAFMERTEQELQRAHRENAPFSLILADIDYFKKINDRYGHPEGDLVLQRFADILTELTRSYDKVARYGGEEFIVCLPGANIPQSRSVAERMRKKVEEMEIMLPDRSQSIQITASFGTASFIPESKEDLETLIKWSDDALYRAKKDGRNRVWVSGE